ncbi:MAG: hypothetical protein JO119_06395 [Acidobacteria bacterium]|nr:hypothetical protein [Acidobacteriota bacterium]
MKNYIGLVVLAAVIAGAYLLFHAVGLDVHIDDHFVVVPLSVALFWLSIAIAGVWLLFRVIRRTIRAKRAG